MRQYIESDKNYFTRQRRASRKCETIDKQIDEIDYQFTRRLVHRSFNQGGSFYEGGLYGLTDEGDKDCGVKLIYGVQ